MLRVLGYTHKNIVCNIYIACLLSFVKPPTCFSQYRNKTDLKGRKADERRIKPREGCEGQDEVKKDAGGKLVKGIYTLLLSRLKDRQGDGLTSVQPIYSQRNKARWLNQTVCNQK